VFLFAEKCNRRAGSGCRRSASAKETKREGKNWHTDFGANGDSNEEGAGEGEGNGAGVGDR